MSKRRRTPSGGYAQDWRAYDAAKTGEKRHFRLLLYELCKCIGQPKQDRGRPRLPLSDVVFCMVFKVYSTYASRKFLTDAEDARDLGLIECVPHFNTFSQYMKREWLTPVLTKLIELSSLPFRALEVDFAVDATGFSTDRYARWLDERTQQETTRREWVKVHLICGVRTHIVTSVVVSWGHESQFMGRLLNATSRNFRMREVSADAGYLSGENMRNVLLTRARPFISFTSVSRLDADYKSKVWKRMLDMFLNERGRFMAHYNKRNNVETTFSMIKANFGDYVRGRDKRARVNEALAKILCHNLCVLIQSIHEFGLEFTFDAIVDPMATEEPKKLEPVAEGRIVAVAAKVASLLEEDRGGYVNTNQLTLFDKLVDQTTPED